MIKYSKKSQQSVKRAVKKMKKDTLKSRGSDKKITAPEQAIAIGLSETREKGYKVPIKLHSLWKIEE